MMSENAIAELFGSIAFPETPEERDEAEQAILALVREQAAKLDAVDRLAIGWELRGESDMEFSKRIPDPDIAVEILANGAQMVENARHIRNALEAAAA